MYVLQTCAVIIVIAPTGRLSATAFLHKPSYSLPERTPRRHLARAADQVTAPPTTGKKIRDCGAPVLSGGFDYPRCPRACVVRALIRHLEHQVSLIAGHYPVLCYFARHFFIRRAAEFVPRRRCLFGPSGGDSCLDLLEGRGGRRQRPLALSGRRWRVRQQRTRREECTALHTFTNCLFYILLLTFMMKCSFLQEIHPDLK